MRWSLARCWTFALALGACGRAAQAPVPGVVIAGAEEREQAAGEAVRRQLPDVTLGGWWTSRHWAAFVAGDHAGVFDPSRGGITMRVRNPSGKPFLCAQMGRTGKLLLTRAEQGQLVLWREPGVPVVSYRSELLDHEAEVPCFSTIFEYAVRAEFTRDDARVLLEFTDSTDIGELRLWDASGKEREVPIPADCDQPRASLTPGGRYVQIECREWDTFVYDGDLDRFVFQAFHLAWTEDSTRVATTDWEDAGPTTLVFDPKKPNAKVTLKHWVAHSFSPNRRFLFVRREEPTADAAIIDVASGKLRTTWPLPGGDLQEDVAEWSAGNVLVHVASGNLILWSEGTSAKNVAKLQEPRHLLSNDGTRLLTTEGIWDLATRQRLLELEDPGQGIGWEFGAWSADDSLIVGHDDTHIGWDHYIWRSVDGKIETRVLAEPSLALASAHMSHLSWAGKSSLLFATQANKNRWLAWLNPKAARGLRLAPVAVDGELAFVALEGAHCFDGPEIALGQLAPDLRARRRCPDLCVAP